MTSPNSSSYLAPVVLLILAPSHDYSKSWGGCLEFWTCFYRLELCFFLIDFRSSLTSRVECWSEVDLTLSLLMTSLGSIVFKSSFILLNFRISATSIHRSLFFAVLQLHSLNSSFSFHWILWSHSECFTSLVSLAARIVLSLTLEFKQRLQQLAPIRLHNDPGLCNMWWLLTKLFPLLHRLEWNPP